MKVIRVRRHGGPDVLEDADVPMPQPRGRQVLVAHSAVGVNFVDVQHRRGTPYPVALPLIPGVEAAGEVVAVGAEVETWAVGDRVAFAGEMSGAFAEASLVPDGRLVRVPDDVPPQVAAAVLLQGLTAHVLSETVHPITSGETVLIHAAASGVGFYLVQLAKQRGATVIGTTSSPDKVHFALDAGADRVLLTGDEGWEDAARLFAGTAGVDVVYDGIGRATFDQGLRLLRPMGHMVLYGLASGPVAPFDVNRLSGIAGSAERGSLSLTWPTLNDHVARTEDLRSRAADVFRWTAGGRLRPLIDVQLALTEAAEAHRRLEARAVRGKVLLLP